MCVSTSRRAVAGTGILRALERIIDKGYVRQDVAHSAVSTGMCSQRGPAGDEPLQSGDSHTEAGRSVLGTFALFKSTSARGTRRKKGKDAKPERKAVRSTKKSKRQPSQASPTTNKQNLPGHKRRPFIRKVHN